MTKEQYDVHISQLAATIYAGALAGQQTEIIGMHKRQDVIEESTITAKEIAELAGVKVEKKCGDCTETVNCDIH